jgi:hypothetical protein
MRIAIVFAAFMTVAPGAQQPPAADVSSIGPQPGQTVADFEAPDQHGVPRTLSSLVGPKGAMLVFYRSADW